MTAPQTPANEPVIPTEPDKPSSNPVILSEVDPGAPFFPTASSSERVGYRLRPANDRTPIPTQTSATPSNSVTPTEAEGPAVANPRPTNLLRWLTYLLFIPLMAASTTFFGCISLLCGLWDTSGRQQHAIASIWGKSLLLITLSPVKIIGKEKLKHAPNAVYASNHLSYMDTPVLFAELPFQFRIFAKSSLWKIPFIGWYLNRSGQVPIDQKSPRTAISGLLKGVSTIKSGLPLVLFPEGGRSEGGDLKTMMSGCAFMAIRAGVPLIPIALIGTYELLPIHTYHLSPRPLKLVVGDPIPTQNLTTRDADQLTAQLYQAITNLYLQNQ